MAGPALNEAALETLVRLERRQAWLSVSFAIVTLGVTTGYVVAMGLRWPFMSLAVNPGGTLTWGFVIGQSLLILCLMLTGAYALLVRRFVQPLRARLHTESDAR